MLEIVVRLDVPIGTDPQGIKELLAMDFEKYGNVRIVSVTEVDKPEQLSL